MRWNMMLNFMLLALVLGIKHSFDADHLIAVSNVLTRSNSIKRAVSISMTWAVGHMLTATLITGLLFTFKASLLTPILDKFELIVGIMLVGLGVFSIYTSRIFHAHGHHHDAVQHQHAHIHLRKEQHDHAHKHMFGIGIVHGLASNDELLILLTAALGLTRLSDMMLGVLIFSIGVVLGMVVFGALFMSSIINVRSERMHQGITAFVGIISVLYGLHMLIV